MKWRQKVYFSFWLVIIPLVIAAGAYGWTSPKVPIYRAKTVYTVMPKDALPKSSYQDMQAANLFIDVIKSWLYSDNLQAEITTKLPNAELNNFHSLSMQTFEVAVASMDKMAAEQGANSMREIIYREVGRYAKSAGEGYVIYNFDPVAKQVFPLAWANAGLGLLVGVVLGGFVILLDKYYRKII